MVAQFVDRAALVLAAFYVAVPRLYHTFGIWNNFISIPTSTLLSSLHSLPDAADIGIKGGVSNYEKRLGANISPILSTGARRRMVQVSGHLKDTTDAAAQGQTILEIVALPVNVREHAWHRARSAADSSLISAELQQVVYSLDSVQKSKDAAPSSISLELPPLSESIYTMSKYAQDSLTSASGCQPACHRPSIAPPNKSATDHPTLLLLCFCFASLAHPDSIPVDGSDVPFELEAREQETVGDMKSSKWVPMATAEGTWCYYRYPDGMTHGSAIEFPSITLAAEAKAWIASDEGYTTIRDLNDSNPDQIRDPPREYPSPKLPIRDPYLIRPATDYGSR
ncbi:hypothetical protein BDZ89DRAFT_1150718 [Hymenopellis radicata]|nr:hypothetical protein BDZ89DRAFT_1150718 [Hymenopellis radicata]